MTEHFHFKISRTFNAPRDVVWKAWTTADLLKKWFGPAGCEIVHSKVDLREGGAFLCNMTFAEGGSMWGKWTYKMLKPPERMVAIVTFTDETGTKILPHPGMPTWPLEVLSDITFVDKGSQTEVLIDWQAYNASDVSCETFKNGEPLMQQGWGGTLDRFTEFLAKK